MRNRDERITLYRALQSSQWARRTGSSSESVLWFIAHKPMRADRDPYVELTVELEDVLLDQFWVTLRPHAPLAVERVGDHAASYGHIHYGEAGILCLQHTVALKPPGLRGKPRRTPVTRPMENPYLDSVLGPIHRF